MAQGLALIFANAATGEEEAFHRWYDEVHLPEMLRLPSFTSARRFCLSPRQPGGGAGTGPHRYLVVYELADDQAAVAELEGFLAGGFQPPPFVTDLRAMVMRGIGPPGSGG